MSHYYNSAPASAGYFYEILQFVTFNTDEKPFPFSSWPQPANESTARDNITRDQSPD
jgi:hypothetical protein